MQYMHAAACVASYFECKNGEWPVCNDNNRYLIYYM